MHLEMDIEGASRYQSRAQKARFLTETWAFANVACPGCTGALRKYPNNSPVADFSCSTCSEDFELKSTSGRLGKLIPDGAYRTMIQRLSSQTNPNLLLLQYDAQFWSVKNLAVIPKYYFTPSIIQQRVPLSSSARRAGWIGCNIRIGNIPSAGKIKIVSDGVFEPSEQVRADWERTDFLRGMRNDSAKGWLLSTMQCIDRIGKRRFELKDVYGFEGFLRQAYPDNGHIKEKLRQQLQVLRDQGYIRFVGKGVYELVLNPAAQAHDSRA